MKSVTELFKYVPAEDESVDPEYQLISNPNISVQCGQDGSYMINEYGYETPGDESTFFVKSHGLLEHRDDTLQWARHLGDRIEHYEDLDDDLKGQLEPAVLISAKTFTVPANPDVFIKMLRNGGWNGKLEFTVYDGASVVTTEDDLKNAALSAVELTRKTTSKM